MRPRGFTLIELILALAMSMIGLAAVYTLLFQGFKYLSISDEVGGMGAMANRSRLRIGLERMISELRESSIDTVEISPSGDAMSFASPRELDGTPTDDGSWAKAMVYFLHEGKLYKYEEEKTDWSSNFDPELVFQGGREDSWVEIARSIEFLRFERSGGAVSIQIGTRDGFKVSTSLRMIR